MNRVVSILMLRDNITEEEAIKRIDHTRMLMEDLRYDPSMVEDVLMSELGLEPDYIFDIIF